MLKLICLFVLILGAGCPGRTTTTDADYPAIEITLYRKVSADSMANAEMPMKVWDEPDNKGRRKLIWVYQEYDLRFLVIKELQTDYCFRYEYNVKTREMTEIVEVPMVQCDRGIIISRASFTILIAQVQDWIYDRFGVKLWLV